MTEISLQFAPTLVHRDIGLLEGQARGYAHSQGALPPGMELHLSVKVSNVWSFNVLQFRILSQIYDMPVCCLKTKF